MMTYIGDRYINRKKGKGERGRRREGEFGFNPTLIPQQPE